MRAGLIEGFSSNAQDFAGKYDHDAGFRQRYLVWTDLLDRYVPGRFSAYDIGCGSGIFSFYLADKGLRVHGFDAARGMIELCLRSISEYTDSHIAFSQLLASPETLSGLDEVDLIVCSSVLEYVGDLEGMLRSMAGLLSHTGVIIASIPNCRSVNRKLGLLSFRLTGMPGYYTYVRQMMTIGELRRVASRVGLKILEHSYFADRKVVSRLLRAVLPPVYNNDFLLVVMGPESAD